MHLAMGWLKNLDARAGIPGRQQAQTALLQRIKLKTKVQDLVGQDNLEQLVLKNPKLEEPQSVS